MTEFSFVQQIAIWALPVLFAITLHEVAYGWVALMFGDKTAKLSDRLSLNPIKHIDPVGTVLVPMIMLMFSNFIFGWAKPVPVDPRNFRHPLRDMAVVALAGPLSNILMALIWGAIAKLGFVLLLQHHNQWFGEPLAAMGMAGITINVVLAVLNFIPLPPLDGGRILAGLLPKSLAYRFGLIEPYGFFILVLLMVTGVLGRIMYPPVALLNDWITGLYGII